MNAKSRLWVIHDDKTILMNSIFHKMQQDTFTDEYEHLQKVKQDNPGYLLAVRHIKRKPNKNTYKGLTYDRMREYIILTTEDERRTELLAKFDRLLLISRCQAQAIRYPTIKNWFLAQFPDVKNFALVADEATNAEADIQDPLQLTA